MKKMTVPLLVLALGIVFGTMGFQFPNGPTGGPGRGLSVLTYNVKAGLDGGEELGAFLADQQADLIGLQESRQPMDERFPDPTPSLSAKLSNYQRARGGIRDELVSFSSYPIVSSQEHDLDGYSPCLEIVADVDGRSVRFLNVHVLTGDPKRILKGTGASRTDYLRVTAQSRRDQGMALRRVLQKTELPTLLVGDFNSLPSSALYQEIAQSMSDGFASRGLGSGFTYKSNRPLWRIDYIWSSTGLVYQGCGVIDTTLSDHKPLTATLRF